MTVYDINHIGTISLPDGLDTLLDEYRKKKGYSSGTTVIMSAIGKLTKEHREVYGHIKKEESFNELLKKEFYFNLSELALFALKDLFKKENMWYYEKFTGEKPKTKPIL